MHSAVEFPIRLRPDRGSDEKGRHCRLAAGPAGSPVVAQEPPGELLRSGRRGPAVPHRQSEPSRLQFSHTSRDRLKLPPSPTLLRTGHLRRKPARPSDRPDRRRWIGAVASGPWSAPRLAETSFKADMVRRRGMMTTETTASGGVGLGRGGRMSRKRKRDAVLRLLRGEDLETLSRALGATAATLTGWQETFVAAGEASLATRSTDGEALETERLKAKLGEMLLERELLEAKIAALEATRPLARRRSRP